MSDFKWNHQLQGYKAKSTSEFTHVRDHISNREPSKYKEESFNIPRPLNPNQSKKHLQENMHPFMSIFITLQLYLYPRTPVSE